MKNLLLEEVKEEKRKKSLTENEKLLEHYLLENINNYPKIKKYYIENKVGKYAYLRRVQVMLGENLLNKLYEYLNLVGNNHVITKYLNLIIFQAIIKFSSTRYETYKISLDYFLDYINLNLNSKRVIEEDTVNMYDYIYETIRGICLYYVTLTSNYKTEDELKRKFEKPLHIILKPLSKTIKIDMFKKVITIYKEIIRITFGNVESSKYYHNQDEYTMEYLNNYYVPFIENKIKDIVENNNRLPNHSIMARDSILVHDNQFINYMTFILYNMLQQYIRIIPYTNVLEKNINNKVDFFYSHLDKKENRFNTKLSIYVGYKIFNTSYKNTNKIYEYRGDIQPRRIHTHGLEYYDFIIKYSYKEYIEKNICSNTPLMSNLPVKNKKTVLSDIIFIEGIEKDMFSNIFKDVSFHTYKEDVNNVLAKDILNNLNEVEDSSTIKLENTKGKTMYIVVDRLNNFSSIKENGYKLFESIDKVCEFLKKEFIGNTAKLKHIYPKKIETLIEKNKPVYGTHFIFKINVLENDVESVLSIVNDIYVEEINKNPLYVIFHNNKVIDYLTNYKKVKFMLAKYCEENQSQVSQYELKMLNALDLNFKNKTNNEITDTLNELNKIIGNLNLNLSIF